MAVKYILGEIMAKLGRDQFIKKFEDMGFNQQYAAETIDGKFHHLINKEEYEINEQAPAIIDEIIQIEQIVAAQGLDRAPHVGARAPERSMSERERTLDRRMQELSFRERELDARDRAAALLVREQQRVGFFGRRPDVDQDLNRESENQNAGGF